MRVTEPLLHLISPGDWRGSLAEGAVVPPSLYEVGFVHLSTAAQVALPADRLFHGRQDLALLVLDPDRIDVPVAWEPGVPGDPESMRFPHAYGRLPISAVLGVLPYRPRPDGGFDAPTLPVLDTAGRCTLAVSSLLRRVATSEMPVTGGVAVLTEPVPLSHQHNQLVVDGEVDAATLVADADRVLGAAGLSHRKALLTGEHLAPTAAGLEALGWEIEELAVMAARPGGPLNPFVGQTGIEDMRPFWSEGWCRAIPGVDGDTIQQLNDRYQLEDEEAVDTRLLSVRNDLGDVIAGCVLKIDGATAMIDAVETLPDHQGRGHGNALVAQALALAGRAGCDLVTLDADAADWPRDWYARHGFTQVARSWSAQRR
ncbi:MAG: GNAT family N-acetyltransferase [Pseudonocardia sp.]|nr:GNAT family N-acetyltransferase [Pseudonocardia sp.]